jgi:hypothetical protein
VPTFEIKQGDSSPPFVGRCLDAKGRPTPTLGATVRFRMRPQVAGLRAAIDSPAVWSDPARAEATYAWPHDGSDTDTPGLYDAELHVIYGDGSSETFPNGEYVTVEVLPAA